MKNNETGRSMVEMLGVLAIVGVLSAGALKGYSSAMFKYKMNQTIDITTRMFQRIEELSQKDLGSEAIIQASNAVEWGLLEKCDLEDGYKCRLPIGSVSVDFYDIPADDCFDGSPAGLGGELYFIFTDAKSCTAFLSAHWEQMLPQDWWNPNGFLLVEGEKEETHLYYPGEDITEMPTMSDFTNACQKICINGKCWIFLRYRNWC